MRRTILIISVIIFLPGLLSAQNKGFTFFEESNILKPFLSEIRSPVIKTELGFLNKLDDNYYLEDYNKRPFIETHLGVGIPILNYTNPRDGIKLNLTGEIGNILLIDMFEDITAPVINTDYFFGLRAGVVKYVDNTGIRNVGLKVVPLFHESTHIGDEFSLHGFSEVPEFKRVNISYEAWELAAVINDPDTIKSNLLSFKTGIQGLWNKSGGYYVTDTLETKGVIVPGGEKNIEYYFQANLQRTEGIMCSDKWMQVLSVEARNRIKFSYENGVPEERKWNFNIYFGWKHISKKSNNSIGYFLRYYSGIIPNGQFRNTDGYRFLALSVVYN